MIDLSKEEAIGLKRATQLPELARNGRPPNLTTIYRWISRGITHNGRTVRLESIRRGGLRVTTREAIARFFEALDGSAAAPPAIRDERDAEAAEKELAAAGFNTTRTTRLALARQRVAKA